MATLKFKKASQLPQRWKLPTGSYSLNRALDGGLESGRFHVLWGPKASTKSTTALYCIKNAQQMGKRCLYIDAEKTFDERYAAKCGVDIDELEVLDEGSNIAEDLLTAILPPISKNEFEVVVLDSLSSILQESFFDKPEANPIGIYARSAKFVIAKTLNAMNRNSQVILISHASIDFSGYKPMLTAQMGNAQAHWTSNIIGFKANDGKDNFRTVGGEPDGYRKVSWKFTKTKQPVWPFEGSYYFNGITGSIDQVAEIVQAAIDEEIISKSGSWYSYRDIKVQGDTKLEDHFKNNALDLADLMGAIGEHDDYFRSSKAVSVDETIEEIEDE